PTDSGSFLPPLWKCGGLSPTLRRLGVLKAPLSTAEPLSENEAPFGPRPARPASSAAGRTPILWKPWSPPSSLMGPFLLKKLTDASVSSAPVWHLLHWPLPVKRLSPFSWLDVRAFLSPSRKLSRGL